MKNLCLMLLVAMGCAGAVEPEFKPIKVVDAFEAIEGPETVAGDKADKFVQDEELVLGVVIEGAARAYPINMLTGPHREIINDSLGEKSIAATW